MTAPNQQGQGPLTESPVGPGAKQTFLAFTRVVSGIGRLSEKLTTRSLVSVSAQRRWVPPILCIVAVK